MIINNQIVKIDDLYYFIVKCETEKEVEFFSRVLPLGDDSIFLELPKNLQEYIALSPTKFITYDNGTVLLAMKNKSHLKIIYDFFELMDTMQYSNVDLIQLKICLKNITKAEIVTFDQVNSTNSNDPKKIVPEPRWVRNLNF